MSGTEEHHAEQDKPRSNITCSHSIVELRPKIIILIIIIMIMRHANMWGTTWREGPQERGRVKRTKASAYIHMKTE
jgi:hypothetical protein